MVATRELTHPMQRYLRCIYKLGRDGGGITGSRLVEHLGVRHASVTNMLKKPEVLELVWRQPYHEVGLTAEGELEVLRIIRRRRLVELYLEEALAYSQEEICEEAERLEYAVSDLYIERIDQLLGYPEIDVHGAPTRGREMMSHQTYGRLGGKGVGSVNEEGS